MFGIVLDLRMGLELIWARVKSKVNSHVHFAQLGVDLLIILYRT